MIKITHLISTVGVIELDNVNHKLYWATTYADGLVKPGIGTSDMNGDNQAILYNDTKDVVDIRVDPEERYEYIFYVSIDRTHIFQNFM